MKKYTVFYGSFETKNPNTRTCEAGDLSGQEVEFETKEEAFNFYNEIECGIREVRSYYGYDLYIIDFAEIWQYENGMGGTLDAKQGEFNENE